MWDIDEEYDLKKYILDIKSINASINEKLERKRTDKE